MNSALGAGRMPDRFCWGVCQWRLMGQEMLKKDLEEEESQTAVICGSKGHGQGNGHCWVHKKTCSFSLLARLHVHNVAETKINLSCREKNQKSTDVPKNKRNTRIWAGQRWSGDVVGVFAMTCEMLSASLELLKKLCAFNRKHSVIWWIHPSPVGCSCPCGCGRGIPNHKKWQI